MRKSYQCFILLLALISLSSCSSAPQLYPNAKLKTVGKEVANNDIQECTRDADAYLDSPAGKNILKGAGSGSVIGGVFGAVTGAFTGNIGASALQGAAVGGAVGGTAGAMTPDQVRRQFINQCLQEKGYQVIGWR